MTDSKTNRQFYDGSVGAEFLAPPARSDAESAGLPSIELLRVAIADGFSNGNEQYEDCNPVGQRRFTEAARAVRATLTSPPPSGVREALEDETIQILLDLLNPLHGALDYQIHVNSEGEHVYDAPPDYEHHVTVLAQMDRDLTQAVLILEDRKAHAALSQLPATNEAGREKALREELYCVRRIVGEIRMLATAGVFKEFAEEPWLKRVQNIDLNHDPVATARALSPTPAGEP